MNFLAYVRLGRRAPEVARRAAEAGLPLVVDVSRTDAGRSPYAVAMEVEDLGAAVEGLVVPPASTAEEFERRLALAEALSVGRIAVEPPPSLEELARFHRLASLYRVEVDWLYGRPPLARPADVERVASEIHPRAARIVYDPVRARGTREIYESLVLLGGYISEIYLSNRRGERGPRLPPFDPVGRINYVEVLHALWLLRWEGRVTIRQAPEFAGELAIQLQVANEALDTARAGRVSRRVERAVAAIMDELMGT